VTLDVLWIPRGLSVAFHHAELCDESVAGVQRNGLLLDWGKAFQLVRCRTEVTADRWEALDKRCELNWQKEACELESLAIRKP